MIDDKWASARQEFDIEVLPKLLRLGKEIGIAAKDGNELAKEIISLYTMLHRSFDPMTAMLLKDKVAEYEEQNLLKKTE